MIVDILRTQETVLSRDIVNQKNKSLIEDTYSVKRRGETVEKGSVDRKNEQKLSPC